MPTANTYVRARIDTQTKERAADALEAVVLSISDGEQREILGYIGHSIERRVALRRDRHWIRFAAHGVTHKSTLTAPACIAQAKSGGLGVASAARRAVFAAAAIMAPSAPSDSDARGRPMSSRRDPPP